MILSPGEQHGGHRVLGLLGTGAASEVYAVRMVGTGSEFALKVLIDPSLTGTRRFSTEAGILTRLEHRNVVRCHGFFDVKGHPAMLLDLARGQDLFTWIEDDGLWATPGERLAIIAGVLRGVATAHAQGIVHRDLKPANILLVPWGDQVRAKVADFGLAKILAGEDLVAHATRTNTALGTLGFMAPEQTLDAKRVDHRADLWSIGCIVYELLAGAPAFPGRELVDVLNRCMARQFAPLRGLAPDLSPAAVAVIEACLEPDPAKRPGSCGEVAAGLGIDEELPGPLIGEVEVEAPVAAPSRGLGLTTMPLGDDWVE